MDNMSVLEQALNLLPLTVTVDDKAVKEAVISHLAQEVCLHLRQHFPTSSFDIAEDSMKQALATGLITTQQKVIANPPTFVRITKKYQRRASTPALSNTSSLTNSVREPRSQQLKPMWCFCIWLSWQLGSPRLHEPRHLEDCQALKSSVEVSL